MGKNRARRTNRRSCTRAETWRLIAAELAGTSGGPLSVDRGFPGGCRACCLELHSFMLSRGGSVIAEGWWWPYEPQRIHMTHSLTKSVIVNGVGIALDESRFSLDDKVVSFFPDHLPPDRSPNLKAMTVRDLLTMRLGTITRLLGQNGVRSKPAGLRSS